MHLVINQSTDRTEQVTTACIDKLYNLSKSNTLDGTSYLRGSINAASAYEDAVTFLNTMWGPDLIVTAGAYYIRFADLEVESVIKTALGKEQDEGVLASELSSFRPNFNGNTVIEYFDEMKYCSPNVIERAFTDCTNLKSIDLTNITSMSGNGFYFKGCINLEYFHGIDGERGVLNLTNLTNASFNSWFQNCKKLERITSLGYISAIGPWAFAECSALESVTGISSVTSIENYAFKNCSALSTIALQSITGIGSEAFNACSNLEYCDGPNSTQGELNLPNLTGTLGDGAFKGCVKLTSIASLGSITSIGGNAFYGCTNLATINFPNTITSVGANAFNNTAWYNNQSNGAIIIGNKILYKVKGSVGSTYTIPNNVVNITEGAFESISDIEEIVVPNSITFIPKYCFKNCSNLTTVTLPNTITGMGTDVFYNDSNLTTVNIPTGITSIGARTFFGCSSLQTLTLPNNITNLGGANIFSNCRGLQWIKIEYTGGVVPLGNVNSFEGTTCEIQVPSNLVNDYKSATNWSTYASRIQAIPNS